MNDILAVGVIQGGGHIGDDADDLLFGQEAVGRLLLAEQNGQIVAVDKLHDHKVAVVILAEVKNLDDIGVAQPGNGPRLPPETVGKGGVFV